MQSNIEERTYLDLKATARYLGLNEKTMKSILERNSDVIIYQKVGSRYLINISSIDEAIKNKSLK